MRIYIYMYMHITYCKPRLVEMMTFFLSNDVFNGLNMVGDLVQWHRQDGSDWVPDTTLKLQEAQDMKLRGSSPKRWTNSSRRLLDIYIYIHSYIYDIHMNVNINSSSIIFHVSNLF